MSRDVELPLTGGCGCGVVRFAIDAPLVSALYCHCTRCQHRTGAGGGATARLAPGSLRIVRGEEHLRTWWPESGFGKVFCGDCGSGVFICDPADRELKGVRLGAFDGDPGVRPRVHQFVAYAPPWEAIPDDGLPCFPERAPG